MTPQELKNSILQLAIQGKLVEQRPEEGTAEELYQQIQTEKQRLIKEGSIKKEKPLPDITEDEIPFDIPDNWKWCRLSDVATLYNGRAYKQTELLQSGKYPVLRVGNLFTNKEWYYSDLELEPEKYCKNGDLLYSWSASFGPTIWHGPKVIYHYHIWKITHTPFVDQKYLYYSLMADTERIKHSGHGVAMIHVTKAGTELRPFSLPPLSEQKRIVAKIEELLPYIDRYEQAWSKLEEFNRRFPGDMQKSLLQMAIQGKLVEQRPEEGTGEELYQRIQVEKQRLIKEGKIKKEKPLPEIIEDEIPFDIPESWKWVKIGQVSTVQSSKRVFEKDYVKSGVPFFRSKEIGDLYRGESIKTELYITPEHYQQLKDLYGVPDLGDILVTSVGTIGNTWICDGREFYYKDGNITQICSNEFIIPRYMEFIIHSPLFESQAMSTVSGTAYSALTIIKLKNIIIPLPPLAEQKRIVAKLEELLPLCERLK